MRKLILKNKNLITLVSGILITIAFVSHIGFKNELIFELLLILASIIGGVYAGVSP